MASKTRPNGYWTKERILADAKKYTYLSEWIKNSSGGHAAAKRQGLVKEACAHMTSPKKAMGYWNLENLLKDAKKYKSIKEWREKSASAYTTATQKGFIEQCTQHLVRNRNPAGYWTKEKCRQSAKKYLTIKEWGLEDGPAYDTAKRNNWMGDVTTHMAKTFSHGELTLYRFFLEHDISFDYQKRFDDLKYKTYLPYDFYLPDFNLVIEYQGRQHFSLSKTSMFKNEEVLMQKRDVLKKQYAHDKEIHYLAIEEEIVTEIENSVINKITSIANSRGQSIYLSRRTLSQKELKMLTKLGRWDKESVIEEAKKYNTVTDWQNCGNASYAIARKNGWFEDATVHFEPLKHENGYWSKERIAKSAKKYKTKMEWLKGDPSAYTTASRNEWIEDVTLHMEKHAKPVEKKSKGYWTKERVLENARQFKTAKEWRLSENSSYRTAQDKGWLTEATAHMDNKNKPRGYWTKEHIIEDAQKFKSKIKWRQSNSGGYRAALKKGWLEEAATYLDT